MTTKQDEILQAAILLFKEKGFKGTSVRDLALELDMKAASLYFHFKSKEEILKCICERIALDFSSLLYKLNMSSLTGIEKLEMIINLHLKVVFKDINITKIYNKEWQNLDEDSQIQFKKARKQYQNTIKLHLQNIFTDLNMQVYDVEICSLFILNTLNHSYLWVKSLSNNEDIFEVIKNKILYGVISKNHNILANSQLYKVKA